MNLHKPELPTSHLTLLVMLWLIGLVSFGLTTALYWPLGVGFLALLISAMAVIVFIKAVAHDAFSVLSIIILIMPFHTIVDNIVRQFVGSALVRLALSAWKELAISVILGLVVIGRVTSPKKKRTISWELIASTLFIVWGVLFIFTNDNLIIGLQEYRNIYEGMLMLWTIYFVRPAIQRVFKMTNWMILEGVLLSIWGFVSRYILDFHAYLTRFGFIGTETTIEDLTYGSVFSISGGLFTRANSIFSGPNEFGLYLGILIILVMGILIFRRDQLRPGQRRRYALALSLMTVGEFISISRNAWIFVVLALFIMYLRRKGTLRKIRMMLIVTALVVIALVMIPNLWHFVVRTVKLQDTSAAGRVKLIEEGAVAILSHPLGIGLGNASYKFSGATAQYLHTEFYVYIIALELGWVGLGLYFLMMGAFIYKCHCLTNVRYPFERRLFALIGMALLLGTLVTQFMGAITMEWIFQMYLWFFVGVAVFGRSEELKSSALSESLTKAK